MGEAGGFQPTVELEKKKKADAGARGRGLACCGHQLLLAPRFPRGVLLGTTLRTTGPGHAGRDPVS